VVQHRHQQPTIRAGDAKHRNHHDRRSLMTEQSVELVRGLYDALAQGDVPAMLADMSDDIEWYEAEGMPYGGLYHGGVAVAENVFGPITADIPDLAITPQQFIASGNAVAVVARYTGTGKATGKKLDLAVVHLWDVRDGKVARFRQFADTAKFLETVPAGTNADAVTAE